MIGCRLDPDRLLTLIGCSDRLFSRLNARGTGELPPKYRQISSCAEAGVESDVEKEGTKQRHSARNGRSMREVPIPVGNERRQVIFQRDVPPTPLGSYIAERQVRGRQLIPVG